MANSTIIQGDKALQKMLAQAPEHAYAASRTAVAKATTPIARAMKANAKEIADTGAYARSIIKVTRSSRKFKRNGVIVAYVGPNKDYMETITSEFGSERRRRPANYAHLVEYGTRHSAPLLVQSRAFDTTKNQSLDILFKTVPEALMKRMAKDGNKR